MSLSGQYLEELSRRYKKQVEELQLAFARTLLIVEEQSKRTAEREEQLFAQNERLRDDLTELTERLGSWPQHVAYVATMLGVQLVWWLLRRVCGARTGAADADEISSNLATDHQTRSARLRRKSTDGATRRRTLASVTTSAAGVDVGGSGEARSRQPVAAKRRRPSEAALDIGGTYADLMIEEEEDDGMAEEEEEGEEEAEVSADAEEYDHFALPPTGGGVSGLTARQQRKQRRHVRRTMSLDQTSVQTRGHQQLRQHRQHRQQQQHQQCGSYDNLAHTCAGASDTESTAGSEPVLDENYEVYVPGTDMVYNEFMPDGPSGQSTPTLLDTTLPATPTGSVAGHGNGRVANNTSSASLGSKKSDKFRRLSSPAFLKSPFSRSSSLSLGGKPKAGGHEQTTGWEWYRRKESPTVANTSRPKSATGGGNKKSKSESPPGTAANGEATTGTRSSSETSTISKKPGSFRRMLKKVF